MADDILFELLHSEIINYALDQVKESYVTSNKVGKGKNLYQLSL